MSYRDDMKRQLCAAIDELTENEGFVLVVSDDQIVFTSLRAGSYEGDASIMIEKLTQAEVRLQTTKLRNEVRALERTKNTLTEGVKVAEARLADLNAAINHALGGSK